jgi:uncharacterized membrane protein YfcA
MSSILALIIIVLVASTLQAGTGFGFSIMATPFLLLLFGSHDAIQLNILLSLLLSIIMTYRVRKEIDKSSLSRLIKGSLIGILPGVLVFNFLDVQVLKLGISILILGSTVLLVAKLKIRPSNAKEYLTGALSGLLTTSLGMPGPPLLIYFAGSEVDKSTLRSTTLAYFVFVYSVSLALQSFVERISSEVWFAALWSLPFTLLGIYGGQRLFARLDQQRFQKIIYALLFFTGAYLLVTTLGQFKA